ncbi:MAG: peptide deformylase [Deltaproteobacteria bacterium]|jgi:peptide deformylase|nr:peptide deformylase [Deltaproteobacteria bacterium]
MSILTILKYPDQLLRETSLPVTVFDETLATLADDMRETMLAAPGAGLAAPQVGELLRLIVADVSAEGEEWGTRVVTLCNPEIVASTGKILYEEGCLSVEDFKAMVSRFEGVTVKAADIKGEPVELTVSGKPAVVLQHEIDHLDGVIFVDRLSQLKREKYHKHLSRVLRNAKKDEEEKKDEKKKEAGRPGQDLGRPGRKRWAF